MSDLPPPPGTPPPPAGGAPPGYVPYGQHQARSAEYAGFWIRFLAAFLDGLIVSIPVSIVGAMLGADQSAVNLLNLVVGVAYFAVLEGGATGQTFGKSLCSIRVVDADTGQPGIGAGRAIGRYFARWLSGIVLLLGYLWMLWDPRKQTWHDKLVSSVVVKG